VPAPVGGDLQIASFNTLNYFTTIDGPDNDARGADSLAERDRQEAMLIPAIRGLGAEVVGLMEIENDGATTVGRLVELLNQAVGAEEWAYITEPVLNPPNEFGGTFGTDAIKVSFIYRPEAVRPVGTAQSSSDPIFDRPPLIQTFERAGGSQRFTVAANHFKSKNCGGATGFDLDQGDGQSCFNARRVAQADTLAEVLDALDVTNPLVIGDLNAYSEEDPVRALEAAGYTGLSELYMPDPERYSFVFDGFSGELDHAMAGADLLDNVTGAAIWHINADQPLILDYNTEFNPPGLYEPNQYRSSDHDPLIVGLALDDVAPSAPQQVSVLAGWHAATVSWQPPADDGGSAITGYELRVLQDGAEVAAAATDPAARSYTFGGLETGVPYVFEVRAVNAVGSSPAASASGTPFRPSRFVRLEARPVCGGSPGAALFDVVNRNAYPIDFDWRVLRGSAGEGVVAASSTARIEVARANVGATTVRISVDGVRHDEANACRAH